MSQLVPSSTPTPAPPALANHPERAIAVADVSDASRNPVLVYLSQLRLGSRRTMKAALEKVAELLSAGAMDALDFPWATLRYQHTQAVYAQLLERYAPSTANKMMAAVSRVLAEAWKLGQMSAEDYHRAVAIARQSGERLPRGRALSVGEVQALLSVCAEDVDAKGRRDAALVAVLYGAGLRRSEMVALDLADWNAAESCLTVRSGKGDKDRTTYLDDGAAAALLDWLAWRGGEPGPLFLPLRRGGRILSQRLSDQTVLDVLRQRGEQAGIAAFSPHDFRRTFISNLLDAGADISTTQKLAGHASPVTTTRYDRRGEAAKRKAVSLLHTPYAQRSQAGATDKSLPD